MIQFDCPKCGEAMEVKDRMAGQKVRCVECDRLVRVPEEEVDEPKPNKWNRGLTRNEWITYGVICAISPPLINAIVTWILYNLWEHRYPTRAKQINMLGFATFGIQTVIVITIVVLVASLRSIIEK
jgi:hypothetical protein